jgi:hypothetical protein
MTNEQTNETKPLGKKKTKPLGKKKTPGKEKEGGVGSDLKGPSRQQVIALIKRVGQALALTVGGDAAGAKAEALGIAADIKKLGDA